MALCCIGGVCVPYTALLPILVLGLQWILKQLAQAGLLPTSWTSTLHQYLTDRTTTGTHHNHSCCSDTAKSGKNHHLRRGKQSKVNTNLSSCCSNTTATTTTTTTTTKVVHCTTEEEWESLVRSTTAPAIAVKFTATWCQPCQKIQPVFAGLLDTTETNATANATTTGTAGTTEGQLSHGQVQLATVDVDGCDGVAGTWQILSLPTFLLLDSRTQKAIGTAYSGSDEARLRSWWQSVVVESVKKMS